MDYYPDRENETARNILRRAEITRLTRNLKSRLALATFKTQRGLQNVGLDSIEQYQEQQRQKETVPQLDQQKRPAALPTQSQAQINISKREYEGLQQGFAPTQLSPRAATNRKRARTIDSTGSAIISRPTSMPAPSRIPASHSVPSHMDQGDMQHLQPPAMFKSSPDRHEASFKNPNEPQTPPPPQRRNANRGNDERDDANLLLYLATSPGRGPLSPRTPGRDLNFNDYLNLFTPSPQVNRQVSLANIDSARQRLTFD